MTLHESMSFDSLTLQKCLGLRQRSAALGAIVATDETNRQLQRRRQDAISGRDELCQLVGRDSVAVQDRLPSVVHR